MPALKITTMPLATAVATAAASACSDAGSGPFSTSKPHEQLMICGPSATAALNDAVAFAGDCLTIVNSTSGAAAKMFADSAVPCPLSSASGLAAPGASTTGAER